MVHPEHMTDTKNSRQLVAEAGIRLGGVKEVALALGTNPTNVTTWMHRRHTNGCPEAVADAGMGTIFDVNEWIAWHGTMTGRRPRRHKVEESVVA